MVIRPKYVAVTKKNIQTSVALDGNPEPDGIYMFNFVDGLFFINSLLAIRIT
jgi:hypothetical protein